MTPETITKFFVIDYECKACGRPVLFRRLDEHLLLCNKNKR